MGIISASLMQQIVDRIAAQATFIENALTSARQTGGGLFYTRIHDNVGFPLGDYNVESDLITPGHNIDDNLQNDPVLALEYSEMINALISHVTEAQGITDLDDYLLRSGVNVPQQFDDVYFAVRGQHLLAVNVFRSQPVYPMATVVWLSSGVATFTDGFRLGTGSGDFVAPGADNSNITNANSAPQALEVVVASGIGSATQLNVYLLPENLVQTTRTVVLTSGMQIGSTAPIGSGSDAFLDVVNIVVAGGTTGQAIRVRSIVERVPQL